MISKVDTTNLLIGDTVDIDIVDAKEGISFDSITEYYSENSEIVEVNDNGVVNAKTVGKTNIIAKTTILGEEIKKIIPIIVSSIQNNVDKTVLSIAIDMAEKADLENVVPAVVAEFNEALENAQTVYNNVNATQSEVDSAFARLAGAMQMLEFYKGDKTALQKQIDQINGLDKNKYIESSWNAMLPSLEKANIVLADENAMQDEVDEVYSELVKAYLNLRLKPNKDLLSSLINQANILSEANYTAASWKVMNDTLNDAKAVFNDPEASQTEVDNAKDALTKAIAGLEVNSNNQVNSGDMILSVKTGDTINLMYALVGLIVTSIVLFENKKRRANG